LLKLSEVGRLMGSACLNLIIGLIAVIVSSNLLIPCVSAQDSLDAQQANGSSNGGATFLTGHPFSAIKYARRVRVFPDGKQQFLVNERYPIQIARDTDGRLMVQEIGPDDLGPECDRLGMLTPPVCPVWGITLVDPIAQSATHWLEGEIAAHAAVQTPVSQGWLDQAARFTSELPDLAPDFSTEDGKVTITDLGDKEVDGIIAHGTRTTLRYEKVESGTTTYRYRIHEVWTSAEMKLIVRVVDGDPNGEETVWGLEKIKLQPDPSLFQPPQNYEVQHHNAEPAFEHDLQYFESWFAK
jgi:hypothetical protein